MSEQSEIVDCHDLRNIQYKTMLMHGKKIQNKTNVSDTTCIERLLDEEMKINKNLAWSRLDTGDKIKKLNEYAELYCSNDKNESTDVVLLKQYLMTALERNRLQKVREVKYNKETETIEHIPGIVFNTTTRRFTLNRCDKRISTISSLGAGHTATRKKRAAKKTEDLNDKLK